eukprot:NODE_424_length_7676_cov_0.895209.p4 type:complete len:220 gc:universal NODE_424_length_7676_cov_0.895209:4568-5227(+)
MGNYKIENNVRCHLLDGFAILIQGFLALLAFSSLIIKRHKEIPRRPLLIWLMDTSKQAFGASFVHLLNIVFSLDAIVNPCGQYILNILLDTTFGVYIVLYIHGMLYTLVNKKWSLASGYYGETPNFLIWLSQFVIYLIALSSMKIIVVLFIRVFHLGYFVEALLSQMNEQVQIVLVMFVIPLIMNIVQFWLIDHGIKFMNRQAYEEVLDEEEVSSEKDE